MSSNIVCVAAQNDFFVNNFFICRFLRICSHLLKRSTRQNLICSNFKQTAVCGDNPATNRPFQKDSYMLIFYLINQKSSM